MNEQRLQQHLSEIGTMWTMLFRRTKDQAATSAPLSRN